MGANVTRRADGPRGPIVREERGIDAQALLLSPALGALAVEAQHDVEAVRGGLQSKLAEHLARAAAADGIRETADAFLRVMYHARMRGIVLHEMEGLVEGPEVLFGWYGDVVFPDHAALGHAGVVLEGETHAAMA